MSKHSAIGEMEEHEEEDCDASKASFAPFGQPNKDLRIIDVETVDRDSLVRNSQISTS